MREAAASEKKTLNLYILCVYNIPHATSLYIPKNSQKQFQEQLRLLLCVAAARLYIPFMKLLDWYHYYLGNLVKQFPSLSICAPAHNTHIYIYIVAYTKGRYINRTCVVHAIIPFKDVYFFTALRRRIRLVHTNRPTIHTRAAAIYGWDRAVVFSWRVVRDMAKHTYSRAYFPPLLFCVTHEHNQEMHVKNIANIYIKQLPKVHLYLLRFVSESAMFFCICLGKGIIRVQTYKRYTVFFKIPHKWASSNLPPWL